MDSLGKQDFAKINKRNYLPLILQFEKDFIVVVLFFDIGENSVLDLCCFVLNFPVRAQSAAFFWIIIYLDLTISMGTSEK